MTERYEPPFSMTENMMNMVIEIGELTGQITAHNQLSTNPRLRREMNQRRSIPLWRLRQHPQLKI